MKANVRLKRPLRSVFCLLSADRQSPHTWNALNRWMMFWWCSCGWAGQRGRGQQGHSHAAAAAAAATVRLTAAHTHLGVDFDFPVHLVVVEFTQVLHVVHLERNHL